MSTRKLILTALICGLAIMVAGGAKLFQVVNGETEVVIYPLGTERTLSDMTVSVEAIDQSPTMTTVTVSMVGVENGDPIEGWRLLGGGEVLIPTYPQSQTCQATTQEVVRECAIEFAPTTGSVTVAYVRAGAQSQWALQD